MNCIPALCKLWVFAFLYARKDRANIDPDKLAAFRKLAQAYARITRLGT